METAVTVFGATGRTGRHVISQALSSGREVTAFARRPDFATHPRLRTVVGNALDPASVRHALAKQGAVICVLGGPPKDKTLVRTVGTRNIVTEMQRMGLRRLVCLSTYGAGETYSHLPRLMRWFVIPCILWRAFADHESQEQIVRASELDWTLVRPPQLTETTLTGEIIHSVSPAAPPSMTLARSGLARFLLEQVDSPTYIHKAPWVTQVAR